MHGGASVTLAAQDTQSGRHGGDKCKLMRPKEPRVGDKCKLMRPKHPEWECKLMRPKEPRVGDKCGKQMWETSVNTCGPRHRDCETRGRQV